MMSLGLTLGLPGILAIALASVSIVQAEPIRGAYVDHFHLGVSH